VLIAGFSTRAAADSAVAAGFAVTAIDGFGDLDVDPAVRMVSLPRDLGVAFSAAAAARAAGGFVTDAAVYGANFENDLDAVGALAANRALWGNPPDVLERVRQPALVAAALREQGLPYARVRTSNANDPDAPNDPNDPNDWLLKPLASGGGRGIHLWAGGAVPRTHYLQRRIDGVPASIVFVAAHGAAVPLGLSVQLVGESSLGAAGYRYCGNILAPAGDALFERDETVLECASAIARTVAATFGVVGVNGIDFVAAHGDAYAIEVNPRWTASMELVERAYGISVFAAHAAACMRAELPAFDIRSARRQPPAVGKAIVFARTEVTVGDTISWLDDSTVRDVPRPGERISRGHPICTVFAEGADAAACYAGLVDRARGIYAAVAA
jgi:predicted ATP-grasp superfamily ATP-dependent carboligase